MPSRRSRFLPGVLALGLVLGSVMGLYLLLRGSDAEKASAEEEAAAAKGALEAQCAAGIQSACDQLAGLESQPDPDDPERQDNEIQEPEVQDADPNDPDPDDPERQNPEPDDPEVQQPEQQDPEAQDPEIQDPDSNDPESDDNDPDDPEVNDPDPDDPDPNDPDPDDPDPNSLLGFAARDECDPPAGEYVTNVGFSVEVTSTTVTYVLTCNSMPLPGLLSS